MTTAEYLKTRSAEICRDNGCTEDEHKCESCTYVRHDGQLLDMLKAEVVKAGYRLSAGAWEDEYAMYAASVESIPGCYGHPRFEATYSKRTGWLTIGKQTPILLTP